MTHTVQTYRDRVAAYFKAKPGQWIDGLEIARVGGVYAYRTRISDCRQELGMTIENKVIRLDDGTRASLYRYLPKAEAA
jgi:hypothetical protein